MSANIPSQPPEPPKPGKICHCGTPEAEHGEGNVKNHCGIYRAKSEPLEHYRCTRCKLPYRNLGDAKQCVCSDNVWDLKEAQDKRDARELGERIGYGRMMQLGEQLWREKLTAAPDVFGEPGGEHATYCAVTFLVPCQCRERFTPGTADPCDWCCGAGRVTKLVRQVQRSMEKQGTVPRGPYLEDWVVSRRERPSPNGVCSDPECNLSGGFAHTGPCEPCDCLLWHAREECPSLMCKWGAGGHEAHRDGLPCPTVKQLSGRTQSCETYASWVEKREAKCSCRWEADGQTEDGRPRYLLVPCSARVHPWRAGLKQGPQPPNEKEWQVQARNKGVGDV